MSLTISKLLKGETLPDFNFGKAAYFFFFHTWLTVRVSKLEKSINFVGLISKKT